MAPTELTPHLALAFASAVVVLLTLTGCGPTATTDPSSTPSPSGAVDATVVAAAAGDVVDPDPHDGVIGEVTLTPSQVAYRDALDLTDAEAHDAFRYSCAIPIATTGFVRYANVPSTTEESP